MSYYDEAQAKADARDACAREWLEPRNFDGPYHISKAMLGPTLDYAVCTECGATVTKTEREWGSPPVHTDIEWASITLHFEWHAAQAGGRP